MLLNIKGEHNFPEDAADVGEPPGSNIDEEVLPDYTCMQDTNSMFAVKITRQLNTYTELLDPIYYKQMCIYTLVYNISKYYTPGTRWPYIGELLKVIRSVMEQGWKQVRDLLYKL